jgi:hypothetical protein
MEVGVIRVEWMDEMGERHTTTMRWGRERQETEKSAVEMGGCFVLCGGAWVCT